DRYGSGRVLRRQHRRRRGASEKVDLKADQLRRKLRQPLIFLLGESILDGDILSLNPAELAQLLPKHIQVDLATGSRARIEVTDAKDFSGLLRLGKRNICQKKSCQQPKSDSLLHVFFSPRASRLLPLFI